MATWNTIQNTEIAVDAPVTSQVVTKMRDNLDAVAEGATGAPRVLRPAFANATAGDFVILAKTFFNTSGSFNWTTKYEYKIFNDCSLKLRSGMQQGAAFQNNGTRFLINGTDIKANIYQVASTSVAENVSLSQGDVIELQCVDLETNSTDSRFSWWIGVSNPAGLLGANVSNANSNQNSSLESEYICI